MRDLTRVVLLAAAFVVFTVVNGLWYEARARALNSVPLTTGGANTTSTYQGASDQIKRLQTTFWLLEGAAFVVCIAVLASPRRAV